MRYKLLLAALFIAAIGYGGVWYTVALDSQRVIERALEDMQIDGFKVANDTFEIGGFPYRITLTAAKVSINTPGSGFGFEARDIVLTSHAWTPGHWTMTGTDGRFQLANGDVQIIDRSYIGSWRLDSEAWTGALALDGATIERAPGLDGSATVSKLNIGLRKHLEASQGADNALYGEEVLAATMQLRGLVPEGGATPSLPQAEVMASLSGGGLKDWSRASIADWRDQGGIIEIEQLYVFWQDVDIRGNGSLALDENLKPLGSFGLTISDPVKLIQAAGAADWIRGKAAKNLLEEINASDGALSLNMQGGELQAMGYRLRDLKPILR